MLRMRSHALLLIALLLSAATLPAHANTLTTNFSVGFTNLANSTDFDQFGVSQFNPALGTLTSISATLTGNVVFIPDTSGNSSYRIELDTPGSTIFLQNYTSSSAIALSGTDTADVGLFTGINHIILFADTNVTGGSASTLTPLQGTFTYNYTPTPTPEPSTLILLGSGLLATAGAARRRFLTTRQKRHP